MRRRLLAFIVTVVVALVASVVISTWRLSPLVLAGGVGDGTSAAKAAPSCWMIKRTRPSAASGSYWLLTPVLEVPRRFYCDMTTDGGGWVLVARGRNGWTFNSTGQGASSSIVESPSGPAAFAPAALPTKTIDGLLNGQSVSDLEDGIRLRRAADPGGAKWQEIRWHASDLDKWTWAFGGRVPLDSTVIDGKSYEGGNTGDSAEPTYDGARGELTGIEDTRRVFTWPWPAHQFQAGFGMGNSPSDRGSNAPSSFWWQLGSEGFPLAFTQVWLRPKVDRSSAGPIAATGIDSEPAPELLAVQADELPFGVTGIDHTKEQWTEAWKVNVLALRSVEDAMFVGGRFTGVQRGRDGPITPQPFLAKFDSITGNWAEEFRPEVNGRVWDIESMPGNRIVIAGDFTSVDNTPNTAGVAVLSAVTGDVDTTFRVSFGRDDDPLPAAVRTIELSGPWIYAGGNFTTVVGGGGVDIASTAMTAQRAVRLDAGTGVPDLRWTPRLSPTVTDLDVSENAQRVYFAGTFAETNGDTTFGSFSTVDTDTGALVPGLAPFVKVTDKPKMSQRQAVLELDQTLVMGGSQHDIQLYDPTNMKLIRSDITRTGGDIQALARVGSYVYASCHCSDYVFTDAQTFPNPSGFSRVDPINLIGAFTSDRLDYINSWEPQLTAAGGDGPWALEGDARSCLWAGGDLVASGSTWVGGVARFCPQRGEIPDAPTMTTPHIEDDTVNLKWTESHTDDVRYWVYRDDRVIAVTKSPSFVDRHVTGTHTYWVRAVDPVGNRSATEAGTVVKVRK